ITRTSCPAAWPPLGLLYIATVLQDAGHEVRVINNSRAQLPIEAVVKLVKLENPGLVGISVLTPTFGQGIKFASAIKRELPDVKIVFGNYHATFTYDRILEAYPAVDYVALGDGEHTMLELVEALENGGQIKKIKGLAFRQGKKVVRTAPRPVRDISELPIPDRSLLEEEYRSEIMGIIGCTGKFTTMVTSRGCPFKCKFCACAAFTNRKVRFRSPEDVVGEMELLQSQGYEDIGFVDDNLLLDRRRIRKICALLRERGIKFNLWAEGRADQASREVMSDLTSVGCKIIYFGIESGLQRVLDYYGKGTTPDLNRKAVKNARASGIENIIGSFVVGAPVETAADVRSTFDFILGLRGMDFPQINVLHLSPGMEFWDDAVRGGYLDEAQAWQTAPAALDVFPSLMRKDDLEQMINSFYKEFVARPGYMLSQLARTVGSRHRLKILKANLDAGISFGSLGKHLWGGG
ncbi:MAG: B12-binding domain-containing radical SAM protein, partial [Planctomycetes bacterium]|nr:B12-binding domain-containing radical SAM protein [Planctomycetota bacterium]